MEGDWLLGLSAYSYLITTLGLLDRLVLEALLYQGLMPRGLVEGLCCKGWSSSGGSLRRGKEPPALSRGNLGFLEGPQQCPRRSQGSRHVVRGKGGGVAGEDRFAEQKSNDQSFTPLREETLQPTATGAGAEIDSSPFEKLQGARANSRFLQVTLGWSQAWSRAAANQLSLLHAQHVVKGMN